MARTNDLTPPIDTTVELLTIGFDFGPVLGVGETIASIASLTCSVYSGTDASPSSRLIGGSSIVASKATGAASSGIAQQVGSMLAGVTYLLQCVVLTTGGNRPSLWTHLSCVQPT